MRLSPSGSRDCPHRRARWLACPTPPRTFLLRRTGGHGAALLPRRGSSLDNQRCCTASMPQVPTESATPRCPSWLTNPQATARYLALFAIRGISNSSARALAEPAGIMAEPMPLAPPVRRARVLADVFAAAEPSVAAACRAAVEAIAGGGVRIARKG